MNNNLYFSVLGYILTKIGIKAASGFYGRLSECRCETVISCSGSFSSYGNVSVGGELFAVGIQICMSVT